MHNSPKESPQVSGGSAARLDFTNLDTTVQELYSAGIAPSTQKTYRSGSKRFIQFCEQYGISEPFPVNEQVLVYFVASLYRGGLSGGTVKSYLAAVRHAQIALGLGDPHSAEMPHAAGVHEQGCEEDDGSQGCPNTAAYYSKHLIAAETSMASSPMQIGCLHAVGSGV